MQRITSRIILFTISMHAVHFVYMPRMTAKDRDFLRNVARAAFANPFSEARREADRQVAGDDSHWRSAVAMRVQAWEREQAADVRSYEGEERAGMEITLLFDAFHRFLEPLDALIEHQVRSGTEPVRVPFAHEALSLLRKRGFTGPAALHYLAVFFQLRRGFYFIARGLTGTSAGMRRLRERLWDNVFTRDIRWYERYLWDRMEDFSTLLLGETGTGKGAAAAALGRSGYIPYDERRGCFAESFTRNFMALNLSQFPESLIESELFGHRKGAFTGAVENHDGVLARCRPHGAIFLDEIGDVSIPVQIKLLHVLQERTFTPVGSHDALRFAGRVIAATNRPLDQLRREGRFRDDFFYRLCSDVIVVPPLRERLREDAGELDLLLGELVRRLTGDESPDLADEVSAALKKSPGPDYAWPGNVRELEQATRRILLTGCYEPAFPTPPAADAPWLEGAQAGTLDAEALLAAYCAHLHTRHGTYEEVARVTRLDRRTVKKYILHAT
jgi:MoxR-like ATPase